MRLLQIAEASREAFDAFFDTVEHVPLERVAPEVVDGATDVRVGDESIEAYDAAFLDIPTKNAVFGRVLLEIIEDHGIRTNYPSTAFFVMAKKNYLYYVLHEKDIRAPRTAVVATEQAARNVASALEPPVVARRLEHMAETETKLLEEADAVQGFAEGAEYEEDVILFHEFHGGAKCRCLVAGDQIVSLQDDTGDWQFDVDSLKYTNISDDQTAVVQAAARAIGSPVAAVTLRGDRVYDVDPNPDLGLYREEAGKNVYKTVADVLKGENE